MGRKLLLALGFLTVTFSCLYAQSQLRLHEYWIDDNYDQKITVSSPNATQQYQVDLSALPIGIHYFNHRSQNDNGEWGAMTRNVFYLRQADADLSENIAPLAGYEYWLDDDYTHKVFIASSNDINNIEVNIDGLSIGTHYFNFREVNTDGKWGAMSRSAFFMRESDDDLVETLSPLAGYEYWLDDDYDNRVYKASSSSNIVASVSLDNLKPGIHYINFRSHNEAGRWGAMTRNVFYLHESDLKSDEGFKIIGYRYKFNDKATYVAIEPCSEYTLSNKIISIPSYDEFASLDEGCKFEFTPTNIKLTREIKSVFSLQFENENHEWSVPSALELCDKDTLDRATVELKPQNSVTLNKVPSGDFNALRLDITESNNYYFKATQPCRIDLYTEAGKLYQTLENSQIVKICEAGLLEGTYYGIVRDHVTNDEYPEQSVTIRMLLTEGFTPEPVISFADSTLTITAMDGAKIYYTLDGTNPTTESSVYTEPIKVLQNCTVKAIAHHPDLAISDVSTYKIDTYKVATPEVLFTNLKVYMSCSTPDANLYYTVNGTDPRTNGTLYTEPVTINYNCTVKVVGKRDGYNDSDVLDYVLDVENVRCTPPIFTRDGNTLTLSSLTDDVTFYYTLDGNSSNPTYEVYNGMITLSHNGIVKAYCTKDGYLNSETISYTVDWFHAATPEFDIVDNKIVMLCATEGAEIYYTIDGSTPDDKSTRYNEPVPMIEGMVVKAIAYAPNFKPSEVVTFDAENLRCIMPTFSVDKNILTISTTTQGASIYYTMDGTEPSKSSFLYDSPITLTQNCVVKAFAIKNGRADSHVSSFTADWFQASAPVFTLDGYNLTITSNTPNAEIYYTIGGAFPDKSATKYVSPIVLTDNKVVNAIAYAENFNDSEVTEYKPDVFVCDAVQVKYNGRYVSLETATTYATIYYTTNGTTPSSASNVYTTAFDVNGLSTIKAIAVKADFRDSEISSYIVEYYFDGSNAVTSTSGKLSNAFDWCGKDGVSSINVTGSINGDDVVILASMSALRHLNLEETDVDGNSLSANAFAGSPIVSISLPKTIENVGASLFSGCPNLAAIQWNANRSLPSSALSGFSNPNLLLYVKINSHAPSNVTNVVASGYANSITLHDGEGNTNFYCPQEFTAKHIEYRHNYTQETVKNACAGWETLSLPFDVQSIKHATKGALAPFAAHDPEAKPFWLCTLGSYGFVDAAEIKANTPYIISMPNNMEYADDYILGGEVTFSAENATVPVSDINESHKSGFTFSPTTINVAKSQNVYALNVGEPYENFMPGATFVSELRDVRPFEAYLTTEMHAAPRMMSVERLGFEDEASLDGVGLAPALVVSGEYGRIKVTSDRTIKVDVYSSLGALVWSDEVSVGESYINNLPAGIYFVNGHKVVVR